MKRPIRASTPLLAILFLALAACGGGGGEGDGENPNVPQNGELLLGERFIAMREASTGPESVAFVDLLLGASPGPFGAIALDEDSDGRTLQSDAGQAFTRVRDLLSDGLPTDIIFRLRPGSPVGPVCDFGDLENVFFPPPQIVPPDVDFDGHEITRVTIEIQQLDFITPGSNPGGTDVDLRAFVRVFGRPL